MIRILKHIVHTRSESITLSAFILAVSALLSRILGLFRDRILAGKFGAGDELDVYYAAFRIPDMLYAVLIMGAVSSAFIPIFSEYLVRDERRAWDLARNLLTIVGVLLSFVSLAFVFFTPFLVDFIAPGFEGEKQRMAITATRIMFLSPFLFGLGSILSGILQSFQRFLLYSLSPLAYNIGIIVGAVWLSDFFIRQGYDPTVGLAWGVVLGAALGLCIQIPGAVVSGFSYHFVFRPADEGVIKMLRMTIPRTVGLAAYQLNITVITAIASTLSAGSIAIFNLANNLQYVPIGIIGISFATAAFPLLSREFAKERMDSFALHLSSATRQALFFLFPVSVFFFLFRAQITRLILGTGEFAWLDTRLTAATFGLFAVSIFAQGLIPLFSRAFYALHDTKTPVGLSMVSIIANVAFSIYFVFLFSHEGSSFALFMRTVLDLEEIADSKVLALPLAFSLSSCIHFVLLGFMVRRKISFVGAVSFASSFGKIIASSLVAGSVAYVLLTVTSGFFNTRVYVGILLWTVFALGGGGLVYLACMWLLRSPELFFLKTMVVQKLKDFFIRKR